MGRKNDGALIWQGHPWNVLLNLEDGFCFLHPGISRRSQASSRKWKLAAFALTTRQKQPDHDPNAQTGEERALAETLVTCSGGNRGSGVTAPRRRFINQLDPSHPPPNHPPASPAPGD